jgi:DNA repair exonuclease SbcCD ATPase subunit
MHARRLLHMTEQHIRELNEQIAAHRTLMRELGSEGQDVRDHERVLQLMIEAQALAMMHRHLLLKELSQSAQRVVRAGS